MGGAGVGADAVAWTTSDASTSRRSIRVTPELTAGAGSHDDPAVAPRRWWRDALVAAPVARSACGLGASTRSDIASSPSSGLEPAPLVRVGTPRTGTSAVARRTRSTGRGDRSLESTSRSAVLPSGFAAEAGPGGSSGATSVAAAEPGLDRRRGDARRGAEPRPAEGARWTPGPCVAAGSSGKGASGPLPREPDSGAAPAGRPPSSSTTTIRVAPAHGSTLASPSGDPASSTAARQRSATSLAGTAARSAGRSPVARQTSSAIIPSAIGSPSTRPAAASGASSHSTRAARTSSDGPAGLAPVTHAVAIARTRNGSPWLANRARATFSPHRSARTCRVPCPASSSATPPARSSSNGHRASGSTTSPRPSDRISTRIGLTPRAASWR